MAPIAMPMSLDLEAAIKDIRLICKQSKHVSQCYEYGSQGYKDSIRHFLASSSDVAQIAVTPGCVEDLSKIIKILYDRPTVQFAIRGGGHAMFPRASSTSGIQISMSHFTDIIFDPETKYVEVGAGCLWDEVYAEVAQYKRNVIGGASSQGVGVGGWMLGAGYSLKSNKYGLGIDNVVEYEIVVPDGRVLIANKEKEEKLFQALRGGGNNFGVVTKFKLKTYPQSLAYGGTIVVPGTRVEEVKEAIVGFVENEKRQEAALVAALRHRLDNGQQTYTINIMCVFDAPQPPQPSEQPFQEFVKLAKDGEAWIADPAGWLGAQHVANSVQKMETITYELVSVPDSDNSVWTASKGTKFASKTFASNMVSESSSNSKAPDTKAKEGDPDDEGVFDIFSKMSYKVADAMLASAYQYSFAPTGDASIGALESFSAASVDEAESEGEEDDDEEDDFADSDEDKSELARQFEEQTKLSKAENISRPVMITKKMDNMSELPYRGRFGCLMISNYTKPLLDKMAEEAERSARYLKARRGRMVLLDVWPFHEKIFDNSPPGAAWPHEPGKPFGPMLAYFLWDDEKDDEFWLRKLKGTLNRIRVTALSLGLTTNKPAYYNNLSLESVPARKIYRENMEWLREVKKEYDPRDVMGRCGGHKIPVAK